MSTGDVKDTCQFLARRFFWGTQNLKYYFRLKQGARATPGNSPQFPLSAEHPHRSGLAEFWQIDGPAMADSGCALRRCYHRGKLRQHQPRMKKKAVKCTSSFCPFQLFQAVGFFNRKLAHGRAFEFCKMRSRPQLTP